MIEHELGSPQFINILNKYLNLNASYLEEYEAEANHTGPALNIKIKKNEIKTRRSVPCMENFVEDKTVLDVDFTIALYCPNFPRDGKCMYFTGHIKRAHITGGGGKGNFPQLCGLQQLAVQGFFWTTFLEKRSMGPEKGSSENY